MIVRIAALCVAVAMICSTLRAQRPEMATALSLAAGLAVLGVLLGSTGEMAGWTGILRQFMDADADVAEALLKGAGVAIISELGAQLCVDSGETALAGRVALAARVTMLGLCAPLLAELSETIVGVLG